MNNDNGIRLRRAQFTNFKAIRDCNVVIGPDGLVVSGTNGIGKTSFVDGLHAALTGVGIDDDAITIGEDRLELRVDMDHWSVRRVMKRGGKPTVKVTNEDGDTKASPQEFLHKIFGAIDPLELYEAKPAKRREIVLSACPMSITVDDLRAYVPDIDPATNVAGHALEVIERVRRMHYDRRTEANAVARQRKADAEIAHKAAEDARALADEAFADRDAIAAKADAIGREVEALQSRRAAAVVAQERSAKSRARIASLRERATTVRGEASRPAEYRRPQAEAWLETVDNEIAELERQIADRRAARAQRAAELQDIIAQEQAWIANQKTASALEAQANELESAVNAASGEIVTDEQIAEAIERHAAADADMVRAGQWQAYRAKLAVADAADALAAEAKAQADALDVTVKRLTNDAPRELFARGNIIKGLSLSGDSICLDGKTMDNLCGNEALTFAIDIAKRASGPGRVLIVDGLERIAIDQWPAFRAEVRRGGFQMIGTRVTAGVMTFETLGFDEAATDAAAE
jgi:recombinational DNA repair ATPase RecF